MPNPDIEFVIERALPSDLEALAGIEDRAAERFPSDILPTNPPPRTEDEEELREAQAEGRIFVARATGGRVMGFALVESQGPDAVLDELDVEPRDGRKGIGSSLVRRACEWASESGHGRIVLSTFRSVPWNGPFYARLGFEEIPESEWTPPQHEMRAAEARIGLNLDERILMARSLDEGMRAERPDRLLAQNARREG